eukprot:jgi/Orpsp1_1/1179900/evm.model.c7180000071270.1
MVNPLFLAIYHLCDDIMDMLVNKYGAYVYIKDDHNNTLLHIAAIRGETPLHKACLQDYVIGITMIKALKYRANVNAQDNE